MMGIASESLGLALEAKIDFLSGPVVRHFFEVLGKVLGVAECCKAFPQPGMIIHRAS